MDVVLLVKAAIMGIVEGLTEFLPISSTGHLILAGHLLGLQGERDKVFEIAIQTGADPGRDHRVLAEDPQHHGGAAERARSAAFALNVLVAFIPAIVLGLLFGKRSRPTCSPRRGGHHLHPGRFVILWAEGRHPKVRIQEAEEMRWTDALKLGLVQCLALVPGTSRSGATIIGGMLLGLSRKAATDFSFYLAIPTLIGAGAYSLYKNAHRSAPTTCRCSWSACCSRS